MEALFQAISGIGVPFYTFLLRMCTLLLRGCRSLLWVSVRFCCAWRTLLLRGCTLLLRLVCWRQNPPIPWLAQEAQFAGSFQCPQGAHGFLEGTTLVAVFGCGVGEIDDIPLVEFWVA